MGSEVAIVVGVYFAALVLWNLYNFVRSYRAGGSEESQYVGTRSFGAGALVATLVAAWASNYTLLAAAESGYNFGISGPVWYAVAVALPIIFFVWPVNVVAKIREDMPEGVTMIGYISERYDEKTRVASLVVVLVSSVIYIVSVVLGVGIVVSSLAGISSTTAVVVGGAVLVLYTALGGYEGTARAHVYQLVIAGLAVAVALVLTLGEVGLGSFVADLPRERLDLLGWGPLAMIDFFLALTALTVASPVIWQRLFSARDTRSATRAMAWFAPVWVPFAVGSGIMGMAAAQLLPNIEPSAAATELVVELFPTWAAILFLLGGLALVFSSGDAAINNVASIVQFDIIRRYFGNPFSRRQNLYLGFGLQILLGVVGIVGALTIDSILRLLVVNSAVNIALILPLYLGLLWRGAHPTAAFWSVVLSLAAGGALLAAGQGPLANLVSLLISAVVFVGLSYVLRRGEEGAPGTAPRTGRRVMVGVVGAVAAYGVFYALASLFGEAVLGIPAATMYPLYAYAFAGCVAMVVVLPFFALRGEK